MNSRLDLGTFCRQYFPASTHLVSVNFALVGAAQKLFEHVIATIASSSTRVAPNAL